MRSKLVIPKQLKAVFSPTDTCPRVFDAHSRGITVLIIAGAARAPVRAISAPPPAAMKATRQMRNEARIEARGTFLLSRLNFS